jgi:hypothetical protein
VTFANIQSVGDPITIQDMNEQEMYDLVLVNLARLVCSGEWSGLLEAGGGGGFAEMLPLTASTGADQYDIANTPPWNGTINTNKDVSGYKKVHAFPFISPVTGTVSAIGINVVSAEAGDALYVAIYSQDDNYLPETLLGYATISLEATGVIYQTSLSASPELTAGTQYWFAVSLTQASGALVTAQDYQFLPAFGITAVLSTSHWCISDNAVGSYEVPPSTFTPNKLETEDRPLVGLKF